MRRVLGAGFPGGSFGVGGSTVSHTGSSVISPSNPATGACAWSVFAGDCPEATDFTAAGPGTNSRLGSPPIISCEADAWAGSVGGRFGATGGETTNGAARLGPAAPDDRAVHWRIIPKASAVVVKTPATTSHAILSLPLPAGSGAAPPALFSAVVRCLDFFDFFEWPIKA